MADSSVFVMHDTVYDSMRVVVTLLQFSSTSTDGSSVFEIVPSEGVNFFCRVDEEMNVVKAWKC